MKDVIKLKPTCCGFEEAPDGTEYYSYEAFTSMMKSIKDENKRLKSRLAKAREELQLLKKNEEK